MKITVDYCRLGCDAVQSGKTLPTHRKNFLAPYSGTHGKERTQLTLSLQFRDWKYVDYVQQPLGRGHTKETGNRNFRELLSA
jgi:hypothetical protein